MPNTSELFLVVIDMRLRFSVHKIIATPQAGIRKRQNKNLTMVVASAVGGLRTICMMRVDKHMMPKLHIAQPWFSC
jgi:hypothetical protein